MRNLKMSLVAAMAVSSLTTSAFAGDIESNVNVQITGDAEITYKSEKIGDVKNAYNETEVNLGVSAALTDGVVFHSEFVVFDGVQADESAGADNTADLATTFAYVTAKLPNNIGVLAGLAPNNPFGTDAFEDGGESWKTALTMPVAKNTKVQLVAKKIKEMQADGGEGDSDAMVAKLITNINGIDAGLKLGSTTKNKDLASEMKVSMTNVYAVGEFNGAEVALEIASQGSDADGSGFFLAASKGINDQLSASLAYVSLSDGMRGGDDFAPGSYFDGNVDSNAAEDTSALVLGAEYAVNSNVTTNATIISADVLGESATELIVGAEYALSDITAISVEYSKASGDAIDMLEGGDVTTMSVALTTEF